MAFPEQSESTSAELAKLAASVEQILPITDLIQGIAQQTNLLALNATIEAARDRRHLRQRSVGGGQLSIGGGRYC